MHQDNPMLLAGMAYVAVLGVDVSAFPTRYLDPATGPPPPQIASGDVVLLLVTAGTSVSVEPRRLSGAKLMKIMHSAGWYGP